MSLNHVSVWLTNVFIEPVTIIAGLVFIFGFVFLFLSAVSDLRKGD